VVDVPPGLAARAVRARDQGLPPAPLRDAATVALLRAAPGGPEVYLLRRVRQMAFAGGMHVFPGGSVDPADAAADTGWAGPPPAAWAAAFDCAEPLARALVCAAVRETFEESGVLLAGPSADTVQGDVSTDAWEAERAALEAREQSLSELLARRGLLLRADLLRPLAHWITPEVEPKRFDTRFFLAELPPGQVTRHVGGEAEERVWVRPRDTGGLAMLPPTASVLADLAAYDDIGSALAAPRKVRPVLPKLLVAADDTVRFVLPGDPGYPPDPGARQ